MKARAHHSVWCLAIMCLATLAAGCGSSLKAGTKDGGGGADVVDQGDIALRDGSVEAGPETGLPDAASDAVSDLAPAPGDLAPEDGSSDLLPADAGPSDGGSDVATDLLGDGLGADAGLDANDEDVPPIDGGLAAFCTGDTPRMLANGVGLTPTVKTYAIVMDCCDGGGFVITNDSLAFPIDIEWITEGGAIYPLPNSIDLASPPQGWRIRVIAGCSVTSASCVGANDYYETDLVGWLTIARDPSIGVAAGLCVHVEEDPAAPASLLQSLDLYVPRGFSS